MKTVEVSNEAFDRIMKNSNGASFDAMLWMMIRDYDQSMKMGKDMIGTMLAAVTSKGKDDFNRKMSRMKIDTREDDGQCETQ